MTFDIHAFDTALRNVQMPVLQPITVRPVKLNDSLWPRCKDCGDGPNGCRCAEYRPCT